MSDLEQRPGAIIFDYGNVLEGPLDKAAFETTLEAMAHDYGFDKGIDLWFHLYLSEAWEQSKRGKITREAFWEDRLGALGIATEEERTAFKARLFRHRGLRSEMCDLLQELKGRYRLAVLSNTSRRDMARYLEERRGLVGLFEVVIGSAETGMAKPEPGIYRLTLSRLNLPAEETLFIDDQGRNTMVAEALGMQAIVFSTPETLRKEFERRGIL